MDEARKSEMSVEELDMPPVIAKKIDRNSPWRGKLAKAGGGRGVASARFAHSRPVLNIRIGNHRRNMVLPQSLATLKTTGARRDEDRLVIGFTESAG